MILPSAVELIPQPKGDGRPCCARPIRSRQQGSFVTRPEDMARLLRRHEHDTNALNEHHAPFSHSGYRLSSWLLKLLS